jgi:hypothetical protein
MLPSNKITNDRSSSPSVKALLNHYYHSSNREKLKEKQNILQTVDDNSTEGIEEEDYHISSVRSSSKDSRHKKLEDDYLIQSFESSETNSSKKTDLYIINNYSKENVLNRKKFSKEESGIEYYPKVTRPKSVPHQILHDYTRSEYQSSQNQEEKKTASSPPPPSAPLLEGEKSNEFSTTENNERENIDSANDANSRFHEIQENFDEKVISKAYSDIYPSYKKNVLNNESHDLKLDFSSLKLLERHNLKPIRNRNSISSNNSANEAINQLELNKIETNEKFRKSGESPIQIKPTSVKGVQVDEYNLKKEERKTMQDRKMAKKLDFAQSLAERLVSSAILAGSTENIAINCLLLPGNKL